MDSYARLSRNQKGKLEKCEVQHADNREVIERLGAVLGEEISDPKLSAWNPKVRRPGWERVMKRVAARACDGVVVWNTDRGWRQSPDLEALFKLVEEFDSFTVASSHGRYDLSDYNDRYQLRQEVAHNQRNSDEASQRITRRFDTLRRKGIPHLQGRSFGFPGLDRTVPKEEALDEDGNDTREQVPAELVERERAALRSGTEAILAKVTQETVAEEWNAGGLRTVTGGLFSPAQVRDVLLRPRNAGLIEHDGEIVGRMRGEPIVDPDDFTRLRTLFAGRTRGRQPGNTYVGSGIATCPKCGKKLSARPHVGEYPDGTRRRQYNCTKARGGCGKVAADMRAVDREIRALVIARLSDKNHAAAIKAARALVSDRLAAVESEIRECEERQEAIAAKWGAKKMTEKAYDKANEPLLKDLARLYAEREELTGGNPEGPTEAMSPEEVAAKWDAADVGERRAMLGDALGRDTLCVYPSACKGFRTFDPKRVRIKPYNPKRDRAGIASVPAADRATGDGRDNVSTSDEKGPSMVIFSPGSGPLPTADEDTAAANLDAFVADVCARWDYTLVASRRRPEDDRDDGRYVWDLEFRRPNGKHHMCQAAMFGVPRDYAEGGDSLMFPEPRLYVDGESWVWDFAVGIAAAYFDRNPDDLNHPEHPDHDEWLRERSRGGSAPDA
ncbi:MULTISPECIES: recombinase family protein [Amycolatopsis]|uniref:recombinase family protein n=1 Tax=Amycolatopsis TaxID=1813 RepID=UPI0007E1A038|nr:MULTISPECIES: recombinase family protein [Amycolatopsis]OAP24491.1 hypothetical protein A4R44_04882 [Amycolatopsis sp. M39]